MAVVGPAAVDDGAVVLLLAACDVLPPAADELPPIAPAELLPIAADEGACEFAAPDDALELLVFACG